MSTRPARGHRVPRPVDRHRRQPDHRWSPARSRHPRAASVTIAADGSFTYTPAVGFEGTGASADTFTYTLRDAGLDGIAGNADDLTGTGTVSIDVGPMVWFIDNSAPAAATGTQANPFNSIAAFNAVNDGVGDHPATGDIVYLATAPAPIPRPTASICSTARR